MSQYYLMHKNDVCGTIAMDDTGRVVSYKDNNNWLSPFLGSADCTKIRKWWEMRAVPVSRPLMQELLKQDENITNQLYLAKNLAISMTDSYWVCPSNLDIGYDDIRFESFRDVNDGRIPYHNATSYDANASLGGQMHKYWDLSCDPPALVKECTDHYGQQSLNEVFAAKIHEAQGINIPFVKYTAEFAGENKVISRCDAFTSKDVELISAYEVVESRKKSNDISVYDHFIRTGIVNGIDAGQMQDFMDYQTLTDFIISNTDEHLLNFGVLRNANAMELIGAAPIFDSGNSMFYKDESYKLLSRAELLERRVTACYEKEEKLLSKIQNKKIVNLDLLPSPAETKEFYVEGGIPEQKAAFIAQNYATKIELAREFQKGKTISLYNERQTEKQNVTHKPVAEFETVYKTPSKIYLVCGLPGTGKTDTAMKTMQESVRNGRKYMDARDLYPVEKFKAITGRFLKPLPVMAEAKPNPDYSGSVVIVSAKDIIDEYNEKGLYFEDKREVNLLIQARVKTALESGAEVICVGNFLSKSARQIILEIAGNTENCEKNVIAITTPGRPKDSHIPEDVYESMADRFEKNWPDKEEGWDNIEVIDDDEKDIGCEYGDD